MDLRESVCELRQKERGRATQGTIGTRIQSNLKEQISYLALANSASESEILRVLVHRGMEALGLDPFADIQSAGRTREKASA